ncbi:MAG TPA: hypothetical protein VGA82_06655 [Dehalococcoidales bacterium]
MLEKNWASIEDFATLFQYLWHRDFPMDQVSTGARRSDWTIHTGIVVRNIADLLGYMARFESGKRKDAVMRNTEQDVIALEWEWEEKWGNEIGKLESRRKLWSHDKDDRRLLQYAVFITYRPAEKIDEVCKKVLDEWKDAAWPLLLILIDVKETRKFFSGREFEDMEMFLFDKGEPTKLRSAPALPWKVPKTRWSRELK